MNLYNQLLKKFTSWAESQEDIRAAIVVGSRARSDHPLDEWADPRAWNAFQNTCGRFDANDSWQALVTSLDLFRWLAMEAAIRLDFTYPVRIEQNTTQLVQLLYRGKLLEE